MLPTKLGAGGAPILLGEKPSLPFMGKSTRSYGSERRIPRSMCSRHDGHRIGECGLKPTPPKSDGLSQAPHYAATVAYRKESESGMDSPSALTLKHELVDALVDAIGLNGSLTDILEDFSKTGKAGRAICISVQRTHAIEQDCRCLITRCPDFPNGLTTLLEVLRQHLQLKSSWPALEDALIAYRAAVEPSAGSTSPQNSPCVYISYAWGDSSQEGMVRGLLVEQLVQAIKGAGITVFIDREVVKPGDRISHFMNAIAKGDVIIIILSRKYLESENCLYELNRIWKEAGQDGDRFLRRVIPLTLPCTDLRKTEDLLAKVNYWVLRWQEINGQLSTMHDAIGPMVWAKCKTIQEFSQQLGEILSLLMDKCEPREFERQAREGFREVIAQIRSVKQA
jgi:hypothetical protein